MKKTITTTTMVIAAMALTLGLTFTSCKKGDTGPAGPTGSAGANGSANVQSTLFTNQGFAFVSANNDYEINLNLSSITQNVVDKGMVSVFLQSTTNTSGWIALPTTVGGIPITVVYGLNQVILQDNSASSGLFNVKVVVIPPALVKPNVNTHNYNDVKAAYNLAD